MGVAAGLYKYFTRRLSAEENIMKLGDVRSIAKSHSIKANHLSKTELIKAMTMRKHRAKQLNL